LSVPRAGPSVSVIIPVFNGEAFLKEALDSVFEQGYDDLEVIVVDDGSTDGSASIAREFGARIRYLHQRNSGPPVARNRGLAVAAGDVIGFLDADDLWTAGRLALLLARFAAAPPVDVVLGHTQMIRATRSGLPRTFDFCSPPFRALALWSGLFRRQVFDAVGRLDETLRHSDDTDWFLRAQEAGVAMATIPAVTQLYRKHDRNITNQREVDQRWMLRALKKSLDRRRQSGDAADLVVWFAE
jgi:glycosyltransferase involved in cell wall biosynthesis